MGYGYCHLTCTIGCIHLYYGYFQFLPAYVYFGQTPQMQAFGSIMIWESAAFHTHNLQRIFGVYKITPIYKYTIPLQGNTNIIVSILCCVTINNKLFTPVNSSVLCGWNAPCTCLPSAASSE